MRHALAQQTLICPGSTIRESYAQTTSSTALDLSPKKDCGYAYVKPTLSDETHAEIRKSLI